MDFSDDIKGIFKNIIFDNLSYKAYLMGSKGIVLFGVKDLIDFSDTEIVINLKKQKVRLKGTNLLIKSFNKNEIYIEGKVLNLEII